MIRRQKNEKGHLILCIHIKAHVSSPYTQHSITYVVFFTMTDIQIKQDEKFDVEQFPIVDLSFYLNGQINSYENCKMVTDLLYKFGFLYVRDPRVNEAHNDRFLGMLEKYYEQSDEIKAKDIRKEVFYQVGLTPTGIEHACDRCDFISQLHDTEKPLTLCPPGIALY